MNTQTAAHTPGPWHVEKFNGRYELWPKDNGQTHCYVAVGQREEDAAFIVRACNAHDDLLAACEGALNGLYSYRDIEGNCSARTERDALAAAIAKAKGQL